MTMGTTDKDASKSSILLEFLAILEDHLHLAALEGRYELSLLAKRVFAWSAALMLATAAFLLMQVAVIYGLSRWMPVWAACLLLGGAYALAAIGLLYAFTRRDPRAGGMFSGTRREVFNTIQWIRQILS